VVIHAETDFYEPLGAHGRWVVVGAYGRCWIPARVETGWRPYSNGYWRHTDAGWYWVTDEPWGWATYHYGRWDFHAQYGWIWVPQTQWAPAWVCWREGGGYVGWAPLRPSVSIGVNFNTVDYEPAFASRAFVFVEHRRMLEPVHPRTAIVNNTTIINNTVNITKVKVMNKTVINAGPRPEVIERESGRRLTAVPVNEIRRRDEMLVAARERNIRMAPHANIQSRERKEHQATEGKTNVLPVGQQIEKPVTPANQRATTPATPRPAPRRPEIARPARDKWDSETETGSQSAAVPPMIESRAKAEVESAPAVLPRREIRPAPVVAPRQTPPHALPVRDEKRRERVNEKGNAASPTTEPTLKQEVRLEGRREMNLPVSVEGTARPAIRRQAEGQSQDTTIKQKMSPGQQERAADQAEVSGKGKDDRNPKNKNGEDSETQVSGVSARWSR
jgi:hypothetical protein